MASNGSRCLRCLNANSSIDHLYFGWDYRPPLTDVVQRLKFGGLPYLGAQLGRLLGGMDELPGLEVDIVVPVPLHWRRRFKRGYNQAEEIAKAVAQARAWPLGRIVKKSRATRPQTGLDRRARKRNLARSFSLGGKVPSELGRVLLVDDVFTTGSTLEGVAEVLKCCGADWIGALVAGRTPDRKY